MRFQNEAFRLVSVHLARTHTHTHTHQDSAHGGEITACESSVVDGRQWFFTGGADQRICGWALDPKANTWAPQNEIAVHNPVISLVFAHSILTFGCQSGAVGHLTMRGPAAVLRPSTIDGSQDDLLDEPRSRRKPKAAAAAAASPKAAASASAKEAKKRDKSPSPKAARKESALPDSSVFASGRSMYKSLSGSNVKNPPPKGRKQSVNDSAAADGKKKGGCAVS